jgi:hypothetical protein
MYDGGLDVKQDYAQAVAWYRKAAMQGDADGQANLSSMYSLGRGVSRDSLAAALWIRQDLFDGFQSADHRKALEWISKAAEQGNAKGEAALASMHLKGWGVAPNSVVAATWMRKAAD